MFALCCNLCAGTGDGAVTTGDRSTLRVSTHEGRDEAVLVVFARFCVVECRGSKANTESTDKKKIPDIKNTGERSFPTYFFDGKPRKKKKKILAYFGS